MRILPLPGLLLIFDTPQSRGIEGRALEADCFESGEYRTLIIFRQLSLILAFHASINACADHGKYQSLRKS